MVIESLAGYSSLGWHLCSLRVYITSVQDLLAFIFHFSGEKSGVNSDRLAFICYLTFYLTAFNILSLFSAFVVLIIMCQEEFFFLVQSIWISVGFLYVHGHVIL